MAEQKPVLGKIEKLSESAPTSLGPKFVPVPQVVFSDEQFVKLQRTLLLGFVTSGLLANGRYPTNVARREELETILYVVEGLL